MNKIYKKMSIFISLLIISSSSYSDIDREYGNKHLTSSFQKQNDNNNGFTVGTPLYIFKDLQPSIYLNTTKFKKRNDDWILNSDDPSSPIKHATKYATEDDKDWTVEQIFYQDLEFDIQDSNSEIKYLKFVNEKSQDEKREDKDIWIKVFDKANINITGKQLTVKQFIALGGFDIIVRSRAHYQTESTIQPVCEAQGSTGTLSLYVVYKDGTDHVHLFETELGSECFEVGSFPTTTLISNIFNVRSKPYYYNIVTKKIVIVGRDRP